MLVRHGLSLANPWWLFRITFLILTCLEMASGRIYSITFQRAKLGWLASRSLYFLPFFRWV